MKRFSQGLLAACWLGLVLHIGPAAAGTSCTAVGSAEICYWSDGWAILTGVGEDIIVQRSDGSSALMRRMPALEAPNDSREEPEAEATVEGQTFVSQLPEGVLICRRLGNTRICA